MSDTPRTDEEEFYYPPGIKVVTSLFSRTLERELAACRERERVLREALAFYAKAGPLDLAQDAECVRDDMGYDVMRGGRRARAALKESAK